MFQSQLHQTILALTVNRLGMSLLRMDKPSEAVRFLDDLDLTLSVDNRQIADQKVSSLELLLQTVIFRVSYRDIVLISSIVNKAIELSTRQSKQNSTNGSLDQNHQGGTRPFSKRSISLGTWGRGTTPKAITSRENVSLLRYDMHQTVTHNT